MAHYAGNDGVRWTADGAHILFTDNGEVWAATPDGSRLWRLAQAWGQAKFKKEDPSPTAFGHATSFDVTPDGNQVVYATCRYPPHWPGVPLAQLNLFDFDYEIAVVGLDGQAPRRLTRQQALDNYPAWSPDGTRIAFLSSRHRGPSGRDKQVGLYTMAADGADVRHLAPGLEGVAWQPPAWSPDGQSLAVAGWRPGDEANGLYLVPADGAGIVRLADAPVSGGAWSPDGTRLAFAQPKDGQVGLYTIAADGADAQRVTTVPGSGASDPRVSWIPTVAWSPDGAKLLYSCGYRQFCVVTPDGEPVGANPLLGERAVWSPDGARIAVASQPEPRVYNGIILLYTAAPDGGDRQPLAWLGVGLVAAQVKEEDLATSRAACTAGFVVPAPEVNPGLVRDCTTLLAARAALFGGKLVNWGSGSPLDQWEGVTVAGAPPRVTGLDLTHIEIWATIPPELADLTHLKRLYLAGSWLTGCIPVGLKRVEGHGLGHLGLPDCEAGS